MIIQQIMEFYALLGAIISNKFIQIISKIIIFFPFKIN